MRNRVGIIGTGMIADVHAGVFSELENVLLQGVYSRSAARGADFARRHNCAAYTDLTEMLNKVDIVSVCTPSGVHLEVALPAIEAGCHLIIEKPLEISLERCDRILEAAGRKGVQVAGVFQSRFYGASRQLKAAVEQQRFGRLSMGDAYVKWYRNQDYYSSSEWKGTVKYDGGGALMNQSIHAVDLLQWFMGSVKNVQAKTAALGHEGIEVEDTAVAILEFANGALGVIEGSTAVYPGFLKRIEISGSAGSAVLEEETLKEWSFAEESAADDEIRTKFGPSATPGGDDGGGDEGSGGGAADPGAISHIGHQRQFKDFIEAVQSGRPPFVDGQEARKSVAIIQAIYESSRTGRITPVR